MSTLPIDKFYHYCTYCITVSCDKERNCSPNGECIYNETSQTFVCRCIRGYYGDGYQCRPYGGRRVVPPVCQASSCICPPNFSAINNLCVEDEIRITIPTNNSSKYYTYLH